MEVRSIKLICVMLVMAGLLGALPLVAGDIPGLEDNMNTTEHVGYRAIVPERDFPPYNPPEAAFNGTPELTPAEIHVTLQAGESFTENKNLYMPEYPVPPKADIVFILDLTGSMTDEIDSIKVQVIDIMTEIRALVPDSYFAVISHMDYDGAFSFCQYADTYGMTGDYPYSLDQALTSDLTSVQTAVNALTMGSGVDDPESYARCLDECISDGANIGWRGGAKKFVVQFGDNVPHDCDVYDCTGGTRTTGRDPGRNETLDDADDVFIMDAVNQLAANNVCLIPVYSGISDNEFNEWDCWAALTGCQAFRLNPDGSVPGEFNLAEYIADAIGQEFGHIDMLTLIACDPAYDGWLISVVPPSYTDLELDTPQNFAFTIEIKVPEGTPEGEYCFDICADGDGVTYATQQVCITVREYEDCIHINVGEVWGEAGDDIQVPVYIEDITGWDIMAFEMTICWCDVPVGLIQYEGCEAGEVMVNSYWMDPACGECAPFCISVAGAGGMPLQGGGVLFYLNFHISDNAKPGMCCEICIEEALIYDPETPLEVCTECGWVCIENCSIGGSVYFWYCRYDPCCGWERYWPVQGARMHLSDCNGALMTQYTGGDGRYSFGPLEPLEDCFYCVDIDYCPIPIRAITAFDASLILQYVVCEYPLDMCAFDICVDQGLLSAQTVYPQKIAANTSCSGDITAYDASLILQYVIGAIPAFPCPDPWAWFLLDDCSNCTEECPHDFDWVGVLIGDVSGPMASTLEAADAAKAKVGIPRHYDDKVEVPIRVEGATNVFSIELDLQFNSNEFLVVDVAPAGIASGFMAGFNVQGNDLLIAMAGASPINGTGRVCMITLQKLRPHVPTASPRVELVDGMFNEGNPEMTIVQHSTGREIWGIGLAPATPNPFTKQTALNFSLPQEANVSLAIYNVSGQRVRTLHSGMASAGDHQVTWDGLDDAGARVARGVYFARMESMGFSATEKVVLLN
ncbi:MAG: FlgD immunoglobulin-like domain containing protein [bacterium]